MKWYPLTAVQTIVLLVLVAVADIFTVAEKYFLPEGIRPLSYLIFVVLVLLGYFFIVRPADPMALATTLAVILGVIALVLIFIQDVIIAFTISWRTAVVLLGAIAGPFVAGYCYGKIRSGRP